MLNPLKPRKEDMAKKEEKKSQNELVHDTVRSEITKHLLSGTSLLCPTPAVGVGESKDNDLAGRMHRFRTTLFHHVALPAPLPPKLSKDDVNEFKSIAIWEEHLRQTKPWINEQKVSDMASLVSGLQTENSKRRYTDPADLQEIRNNLNSRPIEAFRSPRNNRDEEKEETSFAPRDASNQALLDRLDNNRATKPVQKMKQRGRTFVSLPVSRRDNKLRRRSVHKPDVQKIIHGLAILLSYLIEEPPEKYIKKQSWDIFSVPGDKTKVIAPITQGEREKNAGDCVIPSKTVKDFLAQLFKICQWTSECHIISFVLMIRLVNMSNGNVALHRYNWQCMLCVSLMISQKLWDDVSLNNVDFPQVWRMVAPNGGDMDLKDINFMEREFLSIIGFEVTVSLRLYTSCYYDVMALALMYDPNASSETSALAEYCGNAAVARYSKNNIHLLKSGNSRLSEGQITNVTEEISSEEDNDEEEDDSTNFKMTEHEVAKKRANRKYERRHTADVLLRTPPRSKRDLRL